MSEMIYNPLEEYNRKFKNLHEENTSKYFEELVRKSQVDVEENRKTVKKYAELSDNLLKARKKLNFWRVMRVLMIITIVLIPLVIIKITPKIKSLRKRSEDLSNEIAATMTLAQNQMRPLNLLFTDEDALRIIENTIPNISFSQNFSVAQESDMTVNYDFLDNNDCERSTEDILAGKFNGNPFLLESMLFHRMGVETYHGYKVIHWVETYHDSDGKTHTKVRTQTLHATVTKPKPFYDKKVVLNYCAQGAPDLSFTRDATHLERKSEKEIEKYIKKGEKKLKKKTDKAIKQNKDFVSMSNSDFEVLFDALDRTNEVQFRTLFTPLAQTNMVDLIRSQTSYGDDFDFIKRKRTNTIITQHSQGRPIILNTREYFSYSFDTVKSNFTGKNADYFKSLYFNFAPIWAIPVYQEKPVHSLAPIQNQAQKYSYKEYETLVNKADPRLVVHPQTKTQAILKTSFIKPENGSDKICVSAFSYDIIKNLDFVPVHGDDGRWHNVPVEWDEYIPLEISNDFFVSAYDAVNNKNVIAHRNNLCIFD